MSERSASTAPSPETLLERFLGYVRIDTQSSENGTTCPSTPGQWDLARVLEQQLLELGIGDAHVDEHSYVLASLPGRGCVANCPTIALFAHLDTARDYSGTNVQPLVHRNYQGGHIVLPEDPDKVLDPADVPHLADMKGRTIITASGSTLLGSDDKGGIAIIMHALHRLMSDPALPHPPLRVCFNPDEEIGAGTDALDLDVLKADFAYTLDSEFPGEIAYETFSADKATIEIEGVAIHPGHAHKKMINALQLAARLLCAIPRENLSPETTTDRDGFIHPYEMEGNSATAFIKLIIRDFELDGLAEKGRRLKAMCDGFAAAEPAAKIHCRIEKQYRNMRYWLERDMRPVEYAREAIRRCGLEPKSIPVRGGTDGSRLTERGLPAPNLGVGMHNIHGPLEWICLEDMVQCTDILLEVLKVWSERG